MFYSTGNACTFDMCIKLHLLTYQVCSAVHKVTVTHPRQNTWMAVRWHNYSKKVSNKILFIKSNKLQTARKIHDEYTEQMNDSTTEDTKSTRCQTT